MSKNTWFIMVYKEKYIVQPKMTPEEQAIVKDRLREVAKTLYKNTSPEELKRLETIELSAIKHMLKTVFTQNVNFFYQKKDFLD